MFAERYGLVPFPSRLGSELKIYWFGVVEAQRSPKPSAVVRIHQPLPLSVHLRVPPFWLTLPDACEWVPAQSDKGSTE